MRPIDLAAAEIRWEKMDEAIRDGIRHIVRSEAVPVADDRERLLDALHEAMHATELVTCRPGHREFFAPAAKYLALHGVRAATPAPKPEYPR